MNPYTFNKTADNNIEVLGNGQRISTGTASAAERYGYKAPTIDPNLETSSESTLGNQTTLSNANIIEKVIPDLKDRLGKLSETGSYLDENGQERYADGQNVPEPESPTTLFNPVTGETQTFNSNDKDTVKSLKEQGWEVGQEDVYSKQQRELFSSLRQAWTPQQKDKSPT